MNFSRRAGVAVALGALLLVPLAGCGSNHNNSGNNNQTFTPPAALEKFYTQKVQWGSCADFAKIDGDLPPVLQCGYVTVPIDYDHPDGPTAKIAMSRAKATDPAKRIGSLFINPGGPGGSGLWTAAQIAPNTLVSKQFDRIGFDPRGVGASTPAINCLTSAQFDAARQKPDWDNSSAGIARQEQEHRDYAAGCAKLTNGGASMLQHVGTREVVKDLDIMRAVMGDAKLSFLGYSYGTRIGWTYAEQFPRNVRAMVLDGVVDPNANPAQESLAQSAGFQKVFDAFAAQCAQDPNCPLGTDPTQASTVFRGLTVPLETQKLPTKDPRGLGYTDALTGVQQALYTPNLWPVLVKGLEELKEGRGDALLELADLYEGRQADGGYDDSQAAFNSVMCVDGPPMNKQGEVDRLDTDTRRAAPFTDDGKGTGHASLDLCSYWSAQQTSWPHKLDGAALHAKGLPTVVVVSTTDDPATPYQQGVDVANELNASLITYKGNQHTASFSGPASACVNEAVTAYLIGLTLPSAPGGSVTCAPAPVAKPRTGTN
jgi:pimeloyl-ACP methyl ester carboxylesterase